MRRFLKVIICVVFALCLSISTFAQDSESAHQSISFAAYCESEADITAALAAGADYISISDGLSVEAADSIVNNTAAIIIDASSIDDAEEKYNTVQTLGLKSKIYYRVKASASKVVNWALSKENQPALIGIYTGNIYFAALSFINRFGKYEYGNPVQLQTGNQDGVILHNTVTFMFEKTDTKGMFSFVNTAKSAKRTDSARSWDDLVARGYTIIETAYPTDFAEYLIQNTAEREKLAQSVKIALATQTENCKPNRIEAYNNALEAAQALLEDGSSAKYAMADARAVLDEAVKNIAVDDGSKITGDFKITPARAAWALFGIALVLSWQIYFRKHWGKAK